MANPEPAINDIDYRYKIGKGFSSIRLSLSYDSEPISADILKSEVSKLEQILSEVFGRAPKKSESIFSGFTQPSIQLDYSYGESARLDVSYSKDNHAKIGVYLYFLPKQKGKTWTAYYKLLDTYNKVTGDPEKRAEAIGWLKAHGKEITGQNILDNASKLLPP